MKVNIIVSLGILLLGFLFRSKYWSINLHDTYYVVDYLATSIFVVLLLNLFWLGRWLLRRRKHRT